MGAPLAAAPAMVEAPIRLRIAGGLDGVPQFTRYEAPFWTGTVPRLTRGRIHAGIAAFDRADILGQDMLGPMRLGVVPSAQSCRPWPPATIPG